VLGHAGGSVCLGLFSSPLWFNRPMQQRSTARPVRLALAGLVTGLLIALAPVSASAATVTVKMGINAFEPAAKTVARGDTVKWSNKGGFIEHNVQATKPRWYFYSNKSKTVGDIRPGQTFSFTFRAAGRFKYVCSIHGGMDGTITVPIKVTKLTGPVRYRITVASASSSSPWANEVQVRKPGSSTWTRIARTSGTSVTFTPTKRGTYTFRSRVTNTNTGSDSLWSPAVSRTY
jgi:plastocyanin